MTDHQRRRRPELSVGAEHRADLNRRIRQAFTAGAEAQPRRDHGRGLTADELERVLTHYPGDLPADNGAMPTLDPTPLSHGTPIVIDCR